MVGLKLNHVSKRGPGGDELECTHDDVIKWKHFPRYWPFVHGIHRSPVNFPQKGQWRRALMFYLICVWRKGWVNNGEAGDLRHYSAHYDVTIMIYSINTSTSELQYVTICQERLFISFISDQFLNQEKAISIQNACIVSIGILIKIREYITVTSQWARWCHKSPASPSFTQLFIQAQIKENIKASLAFVLGIHR